MLAARHVRRYFAGVQWNDRQLGWRAPGEAFEKQEIFRVGESKGFTGLFPGEAAKCQAGVDLESRAWSGR